MCCKFLFKIALTQVSKLLESTFIHVGSSSSAEVKLRRCPSVIFERGWSLLGAQMLGKKSCGHDSTVRGLLLERFVSLSMYHKIIVAVIHFEVEADSSLVFSKIVPLLCSKSMIFSLQLCQCFWEKVPHQKIPELVPGNPPPPGIKLGQVKDKFPLPFPEHF